MEWTDGMNRIESILSQ